LPELGPNFNNVLDLQPLDMVKIRKTTKRSISEVSNDLSSNKLSSEETEPSKKQKMGEIAEVMNELRRQDKCRIEEVKKAEADTKSIKVQLTSMGNDVAKFRGDVDDIRKSQEELRMEVKGIQQLMFQEFALREERKSQVVIFRVPESESTDMEQTKDHDRSEALASLRGAAPIDESEIVFMRRLGIKKADKTRPIVVGLKSATKRLEILRSKTKKNINENLTPKQQAERKEFLQEAEAKNVEAGQPQKFIVVGWANNWRIVEKKQQ
jgi:hypothetical protein